VSQKGIRAALLLAVFALPVSPGALAQALLEDAWVRALPPTQTRTAAYLVVRNTGAEVIEVTAASAAIAGRVELHETLEVDGMMRMQQQSVVRIPAGASRAFAPGGLHLMLLDLTAMPAVGDAVELCLTIDGVPICTSAETRRDAAPQGHDSHRHH
jgi:copper(I)-binding protein